MSKISTEYRKGVFFVRLVGRNGNEKEIKKIFTLIDELGIHKVVLNLERIQFISLEAVKEIEKYQTKTNLKKLLIICDQRRNRLLNILPCIDREIDAFSCP